MEAGAGRGGGMVAGRRAGASTGFVAGALLMFMRAPLCPRRIPPPVRSGSVQQCHGLDQVHGGRVPGARSPGLRRRVLPAGALHFLVRASPRGPASNPREPPYRTACPSQVPSTCFFFFLQCASLTSMRNSATDVPSQTSSNCISPNPGRP